jgi:glycine cleavage system aminomethyltransferase T
VCLELGLDRLVNLNMEADFIGKAEFKRIRIAGVSRKHMGVLIDGPELSGPTSNFWDLEKAGECAGHGQGGLCGCLISP